MFRGSRKGRRGGRDDVPAHGDAVLGGGESDRARSRRRGEAALDPGLQDHGRPAKVAGAWLPAAVPGWFGEGTGADGGAVRGALAGLATEVGAEDLQGSGRSEGDRPWHAGPARHARRGQRDYLTRGGGSARSRLVQDDGRELRPARCGGGRPADAGTRGAFGRKACLLNRSRLGEPSF